MTINISNVPDSDTHPHSYSFLKMPVESFEINKDTRIARKAQTIPMSQTWSYM
ncbi:L-rhamnose mutarotase [Gossypium arboreum]|uniref:L-rhamnose mutarotase n=1 Tax=Gossypium arboreum TaxID=29729 RepID=A0A0B0N4U6_GOSAR|nr:L-rhamnose mutarotase [Gossypium arboreum]